MLAGFLAVAGALVAVPLAATWVMFRSLGIETVTPAGEAYEREARLRAEPARRLAQAASFPAFAGATYTDPAAEPPRETAATPEAAPAVVVAAAVPAAAAPDMAPPSPSASSVAPPRRASITAPAPAPRAAVPRIVAAAAPVAAPPSEERSVVQKLFAALTPSPDPREDDVTGSLGGSVTAYANPETPKNDNHRFAVYDIVSHTVHMPNGERLEAHSGLGQGFDNPAFSHVRMRGPTPPQTYRLSMRERLFHGVAAIRLNPVGEETMHGRDGMLAHTYMLGARGESNGCVSFRDYARFLAAFRRGEVTHLIVVARLNGTPASVVAAKRAGIRTASGGAPIRR